VLAGGLYWQTGKLNDLKESVRLAERKPPRPEDPGPANSLQAIADKADQVKQFYKQIEDDPFALNLNDPSADPVEYVSTYVYKQTGPLAAALPNPKIATNTKGGNGYSDTEIMVTFPRETIVARDNIKAFLFNMERSPQVVCTQVNMSPAQQGHKPGMTLPPPDSTGKPSSDELWTVESRFTIRRPKASKTGK
jgi:hypothetical protein